MKSTCTVGARRRWLERELHLRGVAVREQAVRADALVDLGEVAACASAPRPAPETPDIASTTIPVGSTSPSATSGASASVAAVG